MNRSLLRISLILLLQAAAAALTAADPEWAFRAPQPKSLPKVLRADWIHNEIDRFILRGLEAKGLAPSPPASARTLVRRLYFDLIGLPPSPAEVETFVKDPSREAYGKLVDRLLKDPRYGERWARFWLDLARYADTAGYEGDPDLPHAWRYRDYVIDALNRDKPYDVFIKEQIAGDEFAAILGAGDLPDAKPERIVAMTFLRLAPFTEPRGDETRHELLSEMTATVSSVFLGLTAGCAKCHDHKYDDIPTKDFYRLKAFFSTIQIPRPERGDSYQIGGSIPAAFYRKGEKTWSEKKLAAIEREIEQSKAELATLAARLKAKLKADGAGFAMQSMGGPFGNNYVFDQRSVADGKLHYTIVNSSSNAWRFYTDGKAAGSLGSLSGTNRGHWFGQLPRIAHVSLGKHTEGTGRPGQNPHQGHFAEVLLYDHALTETERQQVGRYISTKYDGEAGQAAAPPRKGLQFWLNAADIDNDANTANPAVGTAVVSWTDKVGGLTLQQSQAALQPRMSVVGKRKAPALLFNDDFLIAAPLGVPQFPAVKFKSDRRGAMVVVFSATHSGEGYGFEVGGDGVFVSTAIYPSAQQKTSLDRALADEQNPSITPAERRRYRYLSRREGYLKQHMKRLKPVAMSLRHSYGPPYEPGVPTSRVMIRGEYDKPGEVVQAGFPRCLAGHEKPAKIRLDPFKRWPTRSRRMTLADWIASDKNPLTARVLVNRLWYRHFGRGIVPSPSDFGKLGGGPSHPQLLDWLALQFVGNKWSIKSIHKLIVNSNTYKQSSRAANPRAQVVDPENLLLWRFRRRRLEAEAIRDSILCVSGRLNGEHHGLPIFPPLPGEIDERVKYNSSKWNTQYGPESRKRSIYIYQQRTLSMPFLQVFDALVCDESRPKRRASVTPLQALAMYNGRLVNEEAKHFAERIRKQAGEDPEKQIDTAFRLAFGRPATVEDSARLRAFLQNSSPEKSLEGLCRILFNANEFVYVD